jgi:hypothetical protein
MRDVVGRDEIDLAIESTLAHVSIIRYLQYLTLTGSKMLQYCAL